MPKNPKNQWKKLIMKGKIFISSERLEDDLSNFNEIFRKNVTYNNIKIHKKPKVSPSVYKKPQGKGSNWPRSAFLGLNVTPRNNTHTYISVDSLAMKYKLKPLESNVYWEKMPIKIFSTHELDTFKMKKLYPPIVIL